MDKYFEYNQRLGIRIPKLHKNWEEYTFETQQGILLEWESIRGHIPDRIADLEEHINRKQTSLSDESDFKKSCQLNTEIADLASIINDLWLWYRTNQDIGEKAHH